MRHWLRTLVLAPVVLPVALWLLTAAAPSPGPARAEQVHDANRCPEAHVWSPAGPPASMPADWDDDVERSSGR